MTFVMTVVAFGQTSTTGAITGVVTDPTGAILPNATVNVTDPGTGSTTTVKANDEGRYSAGLLKPGVYTVSATVANFASDTVNVNVGLGSTTSADIKMVPAGTKATVEVNEADVPLLDTQNVALVTTLTASQLENLPAPGGDVTTVAFTSPGVVVNAGGSYGNFSSNGLPGISNLYVLNGFDNQDPFLNLNNSGSSNLTLGKGELAETSIVQNGYNSQYGRAAGAIINYITKSGTNQFHGEAVYYNNGSVMNANGWFGNFDGIPRPHAVSNEWAANVGGPIWRDKAFFFADYEGLRYVLPGVAGFVNFPSPQLQSYILATIPSSAVSLYQQAFTAYKSSPLYAAATPVTNGPGPAQDGTDSLGCGAVFSGTPSLTKGQVFGVNTPCINVGSGSANNVNKEWLFTIRGDYKVSPKNDIYARYKVDHGSQPTYSNLINPLFNAVSIQPEDEGQLNDNWRITPNMVNSFTMAGNWYSAYFGPASNSASAAEYPDFLLPDLGFDGSGINTNSGLAFLGLPGGLTSGRNVTQYQLEDDFSYLRGKHTMKAGVNFRRDLVTDYDPEQNTIFGQMEILDLPDYAAGGISVANSVFGGYDNYSQSFAVLTHAHLALYNIGIYAQDEFQAKSNLKLTLGFRLDRTGNPVCKGGCFSEYQGSFPASGATAAKAYSSASGGPIANSNNNPFPSVEPINFQARFGFNYSPMAHTSIRGGIGMFSDLYPAGFLDGVIDNFPNYNAIAIYNGTYAAGTGAGSLRAEAASANAGFVSGFKSGQGLTGINNNVYGTQGVAFNPPSIGAYFPAEFKVPEYLEFSFQIQQQLGPNFALIATYAGNHGYNLVLTNPYENAAAGDYDNTSGAYLNPNGPKGAVFGGLPLTPPDPRFNRVTAYTNNGVSNYDGMQLTLKHTGHGFTGQISYTWSHDLDTVSNGGEGENWNFTSVTNQITPNLSKLNLNYSNADYDIRNNVVGDFVYDEPFHFSNYLENSLFGGWIASAKTYARGGSPFSVNNVETLGQYYNLGTFLSPDKFVSHLTNTCGNSPHAATLSPCLQSTDYFDAAGDPQTDFGTVRRNSYRGPHYFDTDFSLSKLIVKAENLKFSIGGDAYNVFNHPNFAAPNPILQLGTFGLITSTAAPPTSPYGSFQGAQVTQRVLQVHAKIAFLVCESHFSPWFDSNL
jgi:hypothetical protein